MARDSSKPGKSETLTIRLDPKTRFVLEYLSRLKGQTITTVVERALVSAASEETVRDPTSPDQPLGWQYFWDVSEGVRALKLARRAEFFPLFEEERRLMFTRDHWPFFYNDRDTRQIKHHFVDVLWPRIDEFVQMHEDQRSNDYFAAGKAMQQALRKAKLGAPEWPVPDKNVDVPSKGTSRTLPSDEIDDDISDELDDSLDDEIPA